MPKPEIDFKPAASFASSPTTSTLTTTILVHDPDTGDRTAILTHAPGSSWGDLVCKHEYWEECYIIEGRLFDKSLEKWFGGGYYCCRPPGMIHGPYKADPERGCKENCYTGYGWQWSKN